MRAILLAFLLSGCIPAGAYVDATIAAGKEAKNIEARLLAAGLCAMSVGALSRNFSDSEIEGILKVCANSGITLRDFEEARQADELIRGRATP